MFIEQHSLGAAECLRTPLLPAGGGPFHLVTVFGAVSLLGDSGLAGRLKAAFPGALIVGCSTAGEIFGTRVSDETLSVTAVRFENSVVKGAQLELARAVDSFDAGQRLARALAPSIQAGGETLPLAHVLIFSDGLKVNGSSLARGLASELPSATGVTGGLAGDGARFQKTLVFCDGPARSDAVVAVGFYSRRLKIGFGSQGGWDPFGPERLITRSNHNVLYELDGQSVLGLYKQYLGSHAEDLPAAGLLFPLSLRGEDGAPGLVRTLLSISEAEQSMTFAGDLPEGAYARLMKANRDRLIDGAVGAAKICLQSAGAPELALLISCVGRKLVFKQRVEEEVEGVRGVLGSQAALTGFYSYGEICPFVPGGRCELHNQTMTITTFSES